MKCCICGKEIKNFGNNPYGAINRIGKIIHWEAGDECCNQCNEKYVIPGRLAAISIGSFSDVEKVIQ